MEDSEKYDYLEIKKECNTLKKELEMIKKKIEKAREEVELCLLEQEAIRFESNEKEDAFRFWSYFMHLAKKRLVIIDPYVQKYEPINNYLSMIIDDMKVNITIYTSNISKERNVVNKRNVKIMEYRECEKVPSPYVSFVIIDNNVFALDNTLYKMGEKMLLIHLHGCNIGYFLPKDCNIDDITN